MSTVVNRTYQFLLQSPQTRVHVSAFRFENPSRHQISNRFIQSPDISAEKPVWHVSPDGGKKENNPQRTAGAGDAQILWRNARKGRNDAQLLIKNTHTSTIDEGNARVPIMTFLLGVCESRIHACVPSTSRVCCLSPPSPMSLFPIQEERLRCLFSFLQ